MKEILKAIAKMTILANTKHVPEEEYSKHLAQIHEIGRVVLNTHKTIDYDQMWGGPPPEPVKPTETIDAIETTEKGI